MLRIKELREKAGLNQEQLAAILPVGKTSISNYENGNRTLSIATLTKLADYFHVSVDYLIGYTDNPDPFPGEETHLIHADERRFVEGFRKLSPEDRRLFQDLMDRFPKHEKK